MPVSDVHQDRPWAVAQPIERTRSEPDAPEDLAATELTARVEHVRFTSPETGWSVMGISYGPNRTATAVGSMMAPHPGDIAVLHGEWCKDGKWGWQFKFTTYTPHLPADAQQAEDYLSSGRIKGIGTSTARAIVKHFGDATLQILDESIERLEEVPGIGPKKRKLITEGWAESVQQRAIAMALIAVGASTTLATPIWDAFGADGAKLISTEPYKLTKAKGVGFLTCDKIAAQLGWSKTDPRRIAAGLVYTIEEAEKDGHCYLPIDQLIERSAAVLQVPVGMTAAAVNHAVADELIVVDDERAYTDRMHYLEGDLAVELDRLASAAVARPSAVQAKQIDELLAERGLTEEQEQAVRSVLEQPLTVLTGGPGVGKSHTVATIAAVADLCRWQMRLCAPTGRAARRMSEMADGAEAATVHRLLGLGGGDGARFDPEEPMVIDLLVCDESSMLDVSLARHLVRAIGKAARVLFVGDIDQLPSVGPGSVLRDLIDSGRAGVTALTRIFRQGKDSGIVQVAHTVNAGKLTVDDSGKLVDLEGWDDLHFWPTDEPDVAADRVVEMVCHRIPTAFGTDPRDIQVLAPKRKGSCGTVALNARLQARLNPGRGREYTTTMDGQPVAFRPGDRAMIIKNNYDKGPETLLGHVGVFNGTPARVIDVDPAGGDNAVVVETDEGHRVAYAASEVKELALAYAITIHKSQGSQYPCVVIPVTMQAYTMLVRNLIYTAITRAQKRVVLVGSPRAIAKAVRTVDAQRRFTGLCERLIRLGNARG